MNRYARTTHWATLSVNTSQSSTTPELDSLLQTLSTLLGFLSRAVGTVPLRRLVLKVLEALDERFIDMLVSTSVSDLPLPGAAVAAASVVSGHEARGVLLFSLQGAKQFRTDVESVASFVAGVVDDDIVSSGMGRVREAVELLSIPVESQIDEDDEDDEKPMTLFQVQKKLMGSGGDQARELLDGMGLSRLGVGEARKIIARRVELGG
jgi:RAD50-interacting protein 1